MPSYPAASSSSDLTDPDMPEAQAIGLGLDPAAPMAVVDLEDDAELEPADRGPAASSFWDLSTFRGNQDYLYRQADRYSVAHVWGRLCKLHSRCVGGIDVPEQLQLEQLQKHRESATLRDLECLEKSVVELSQIVGRAEGFLEPTEPLRRACSPRDVAVSSRP